MRNITIYTFYTESDIFIQIEYFWYKIVSQAFYLLDRKLVWLPEREQLVRKQVSEKYRFAWFKLYATRSIRRDRGKELNQ